MRTPTQKIKVENFSLTQMQENGWDLSDNNKDEKEIYGKFASQALINQLTGKQRRVVICLNEGMKRQEIANHLLISLQEVHQIIARIRRRIEDKKVDKMHMQSLENLVWVFYYYTNSSAKKLYDNWNKDVLLNDYQRPSIATLKKWIKGYSLPSPTGSRSNFSEASPTGGVV